MPFHKFAMINVPVLALAAWQLIDLEPASGPISAVKIFGDGMAVGDETDTRRFTWSPDGSLLAFVLDNSRVHVLDTTTGDVSFIVDAKKPRDIDWRMHWQEES